MRGYVALVCAGAFLVWLATANGFAAQNQGYRAVFPSTQWDITYTCLPPTQGFSPGWEWHAGAWPGQVAFAVRENPQTGKTDFCVIHLVPVR